MKKAVVLNADLGYLTQLTTIIKSIMAHHKDIKFYIFNEDLPREWFQSIRRQIQLLNSEIVDVKVDANKVKQFSLPQQYLHYSAYFRYFIAEYVVESRAIYLDSDMIVTDNLDELFELDLEGYPVGAVEDYPYHHFNSGFLLVDVDYWKQEQVAQRLLDLTAQYHQVDYGDQGILNRYFEDNWLRLEQTYNTMVGLDSQFRYNPSDIWYQQDYQVIPKVIHYITENKPWKQLRFNRYRDIWWFYYALTWEDILLRRYLTSDFESLMQRERYNAVVFTESGDLCHLADLIEALPEVDFHIAAPTLFWEGITNLETHENVSVYPMVDPFTKQKLLDEMDCYLDINYGNEHDGILEKVAKLNKPLFAFSSTAHSDSANIFADENWEEVVAAIRAQLKIVSDSMSKG